MVEGIETTNFQSLEVVNPSSELPLEFNWKPYCRVKFGMWFCQAKINFCI